MLFGLLFQDEVQGISSLVFKWCLTMKVLWVVLWFRYKRYKEKINLDRTLKISKLRKKW